MDRSFDLILPKFTLKCPYHPSQTITKGCTDYKCSKNSLCCQQCDHHTESHLKSIEEFVLFLSENIENLSIDNSKLYEEIFLSSENVNLSKWQEDNTEHLKKVEDHLIAQKVLIAEDMANLISQISETCQNVKMELMNKLDDYFTNYKNNFNGFKNLLDESFIINKKYKYYGNVNNLAAKISGELPKNLNSMIYSIKNVIIKSQEISENRKITIKKFKKMADELNELTNSLPFYKNSLSYDKFSDELSLKINKYFISQIDFPSSQNQDGIFNKKVLEKLDINKENPVQKSRSKPSEKIFESRAEPLKIDILPSFNNYLDPLNKTYYSSDNKSLIVSTSTNKYLSEFSLKLQKMIQIDFPITCANVISDNLLALGGKDSFLRVYDIKMQKVIYTVAAHNEPIVSLSRIFSDDKLINPQLVNNGKKRILLASSSLDKTVYIWLISDGGNPSIYQKLAGFFAPIQSFLELEDGVCLITGDTNGELIVWDYHKAKVLFVFRGQHSSKISGFITYLSI